MKVMHKLLLLSVLPFLFIILSIIFVSKYQSESILQQKITESANLELNLHTERIAGFFLKKVDELKLMSSTPVVQRGSIPEILSYFEMEQKRLSRHIEGLYYNDLEGTVYDVAGGTFSVRDRYYFPRIARGEVVITKVIKSRATQKPIVLMLVPIFDTNGNRTGAVGGTILVKDLLQMIMDIKVGQSGFAVMVDEDDRVVSSFGEPRSSGKDLFLKPLDTTDSTEGLRRVIKNIPYLKHNAARVVYDKSSYYAFFNPIKTMKWSLVLMYKESEVLADLKQMNTLYVLICLCGVIAICLFTYGTKRIVLDPILTLVSVQQQFGEGDLSARSKNTSQDEFGALSRSFNNMADQLSERTTRIENEVTERKQAEESLRESEEKYRLLAENVNDVIWTSDLNLNMTYVSPSIQRFRGYTVEEIMALKVEEQLTPESMAVATQVLSEELEIESKEDKDLFRSRTLELESICKDGSTRWSETNFSFIRDSNEKAIGILGVGRDITDRKQAKEERLVLQAQLQQAQKMESIGTLAGGIAHDFNNILFPMFGYLEMMLEDVPEDTPMHGKLAEVFNGALRARDLVQQILTFSRQTEHEKKPLKVQVVIKEALKLIHSSLPTTIVIHQNISNECEFVMADPTQIHQIAMNLITNAYHAMEETGGKLTITLKEVELPAEDLKDPAMIPGPHVCLTVADTGPGMKQSIIDRIFDPYFTTKEEGKGTGLGLAVVHGIVKSHGGQISIYSEPGNGTEFKVYLPVIKGQKETSKAETDTPIQKGDERILLVDDEDIIVQIEKQMLERLGYHVTVRTSSLDTLEAFRANPDKFDLVITDMTMPNMTGEQLAGEILKIRSDTPVIVCTGFSEMMSKEKAGSLGIKGFLMKPVVIKDLSGMIRKVLAQN